MFSINWFYFGSCPDFGDRLLQNERRVKLAFCGVPDCINLLGNVEERCTDFVDFSDWRYDIFGAGSVLL